MFNLLLSSETEPKMNYRCWKVIEVWNDQKWIRNTGGGLFRNRALARSIAFDIEYLRGVPARIRVIR